MKLLIIFNPKAAYGRSARKLEEIRLRFNSLGIEVCILSTEYSGHARKLVKTARLSDFDGVVAAGGDGTVFEVLNGLYEHPKPARIPLGMLPIGTGNVIARELGLRAAAWADAVDMLQRGQTRQVDVGFVESQNESFYFVNVLHMGFTIDAGRTAQKLKLLGNSAYTLATLWQVLKLKSYPLVIEIDGEIIQSDNVFVAFSNSRYTGTHFLIAPDAVIDDGRLDVILLRKLSRFRLLKLFPTIYEGRHVEYEEVSTHQATHIRILSPEAMPLGPDGEFFGKSPVDITCLQRDLEVFC